MRNELENGWLVDNNYRSVDYDEIGYCSICQETIYSNQDYHIVDGEKVCCHCYEEEND